MSNKALDKKNDAKIHLKAAYRLIIEAATLDSPGDSLKPEYQKICLQDAITLNEIINRL